MLDFAENLFKNSLNFNGSNINALFGLVNCCLSKKNYQNAVDLIIFFLQQQPPHHIVKYIKNELVWFYLSKSFLNLNKFNASLILIQNSLLINPQNLDALLLNGEILIQLKQYNNSINLFQSVIMKLKNKPVKSNLPVLLKAHEFLSLIYIKLNKPSLALQELLVVINSTATNKNPDFLKNYLNYSLILNDLNESLSTLDKAYDIYGLNINLILTKAFLYLQPNTKHFNPNFAIDILSPILNNNDSVVIIDNNDDDFLPWFLLGKAYFYLDQSRQSYDYFQLALKKGPNSPLPWLAVGTLYLKLNQLSDALTAFSEAARILSSSSNPNNSTNVREQEDEEVLSISDLYALASAWEGLSCIYERCDNQAEDAAGALFRAAACYRAIGDKNSMIQSEQRAQLLISVSKSENLSPPSPRSFAEPNYLIIKDSLTLEPDQRVKISNDQQNQQQIEDKLPAILEQFLDPVFQKPKDGCLSPSSGYHSIEVIHHQPISPRTTQQKSLKPSRKRQRFSSSSSVPVVSAPATTPSAAPAPVQQLPPAHQSAPIPPIIIQHRAPTPQQQQQPALKQPSPQKPQEFHHLPMLRTKSLDASSAESISPLSRNPSLTSNNHRTSTSSVLSLIDQQQTSITSTPSNSTQQSSYYTPIHSHSHSQSHSQSPLNPNQHHTALHHQQQQPPQVAQQQFVQLSLQSQLPHHFTPPPRLPQHYQQQQQFPLQHSQPTPTPQQQQHSPHSSSPAPIVTYNWK